MKNIKKAIVVFSIMAIMTLVGITYAETWRILTPDGNSYVATRESSATGTIVKMQGITTSTCTTYDGNKDFVFQPCAVTVTAAVAGWYEVATDTDTIYVTTNMRVILNGVEMVQ